MNTARRENSANSGQGGKGRSLREVVLYVEDEETLYEVAEFRLRKSYEVLHAADDRSACTILRERGSELGAILMDIQLMGSRLDGIQLARLVRGTLPAVLVPDYAKDVPKLPAIPIVFVTAYTARYEEPELIAVGGNLVVAKPVDFAKLTSALTNFYLSRLPSRG